MDARLGPIRAIDRGVNLAKALIVLDQASERSGLKNIDSALQKLGDSSAGGRKVIDLEFPAMYSIHGIDVWNEVKQGLANKSLTNEDALGIIMVFNELIHRIARNDKGLYPLLTEQKLLEFIVDYDNWVDKVNRAMLTGEISGADVTTLRAEQKKLKQRHSGTHVIYAIPGNLTLADLSTIKTFLENPSSGSLNIPIEIGSAKIATNSFSNFRSTINDRIKELWTGYTKSTGTTKDAEKEVFEGIQARTGSQLDKNKLTTIYNWGHTATEDPGTGVRRLVSPKILSQLVSANFTSDQRQIVNYDFQVETKQINTVIKTSQRVGSQQAVLEIAIESGFFQSVLFQNREYNQITLGQQEKAYNIRTRLKDDPKFKQAVGVATIEQLGLGLASNHSSLSFKEKLLGLIGSALTGKAPGTNIVGTSTKVETSKRTVKALVPKVKNNLKQGTRPQVAKPTSIKLAVASTSSIANLQALLDAQLVQTIKQNMGTGARRDILNLRTGRFAESVKVERLSESRQGMITAFYRYMRNPYATFSQGGRQQFPRSRDPKLLIANSIRDVAKQLAITKLRAQLI